MRKAGSRARCPKAAGGLELAWTLVRVVVNVGGACTAENNSAFSRRRSPLSGTYGLDPEGDPEPEGENEGE